MHHLNKFGEGESKRTDGDYEPTAIIRAKKNDQVVAIPPSKKCAKPTARPCVILKARGCIAGATFNLL